MALALLYNVQTLPGAWLWAGCRPAAKGTVASLEFEKTIVLLWGFPTQTSVIFRGKGGFFQNGSPWAIRKCYSLGH